MRTGQELVRVAVVSPHEVTRRGLSSVLVDAPDRVCLAAATRTAGEVADVLDVDVVVYDLASVAEAGPGALGGLASRATPVLGLEVLGRTDLTESALELGVVNVVPRSVSAGRLVSAVEAVARGHGRTAADYRQARHDDVRATHGVTGREATVLALVAAGLTNREIARRLYLSPNSVKTYIRTAYRRIGARSRAEAVVWALRHGLAEADQRVPSGEQPADG